ncbi:MAG: TIGR03749 family integrating conjugative element protein [Gilliamella apicola]|nr:TIGR03749 family integrating conjugative element protein [Gilliamella apicola]
MKNKLFFRISWFLMFICMYLFNINRANAIELINWDKKPIKITINQNEERMIILDKNISVGLPLTLQNKLRIQSLGGVLYLKSNVPFDETRLMLKDLETGEIILIDLTGEKVSKRKLETIKIVTEGKSQQTENSNNFEIIGQFPTTNNEQTLPVPVLLTRYAAQSYYAPLRTIEKVPGIRQISMPLPKTLTRLIPRLPITVNPQAVWRLKGYEVVAIKLRNQSDKIIYLDPRLLQGHSFYSATFQHNTLGPKGQPTDTTMLYIVVKGKVQNAFLTEPVLSNQEKDKTLTELRKENSHAKN